MLVFIDLDIIKIKKVVFLVCHAREICFPSSKLVEGETMKYIIFICEIIAMFLLLTFAPLNIWFKIIGIIIIVCLSQFAHTKLNAR